ncbi:MULTISPECIES: hypothetical protein [Pseudomonas]|uniref:hypothetical protein n=1 Tax=Pseudomonas TaxID=286 RepID=UPI00057942AA|nr:MULTISPECIES: hypothetical protein [Pseudomonas]AOS41749.1 hypothetical protein A0U95_24165 [Pseudomonas brassicacearum]RDI09205.1 hypothetical protein DFO59_101620 [Pseudomonas fluorescens]WLG66740.1 hypothetical protein PSH71_22445 [Pseudomonas brassicacearum]
MKNTYDLHDVWGLLFVFSIENTHDVAREEIITSKNVNDDEELGQLFDLLIRPEFLFHSPKEQILLINTLSYFLENGDSFDRVFLNLDTYFDDDVNDQRQFMRVLLASLMRYQAES